MRQGGWTGSAREHMNESRKYRKEGLGEHWKRGGSRVRPLLDASSLG
jgi:hypothetical protein